MKLELSKKAEKTFAAIAEKQPHRFSGAEDVAIFILNSVLIGLKYKGSWQDEMNQLLEIDK